MWYFRINDGGKLALWSGSSWYCDQNCWGIQEGINNYSVYWSYSGWCFQSQDGGEDAAVYFWYCEVDWSWFFISAGQKAQWFLDRLHQKRAVWWLSVDLSC